MRLQSCAPFPLSHAASPSTKLKLKRFEFETSRCLPLPRLLSLSRSLCRSMSVIRVFVASSRSSSSTSSSALLSSSLSLVVVVVVSVAAGWPRPCHCFGVVWFRFVWSRLVSSRFSGIVRCRHSRAHRRRCWPQNPELLAELPCNASDKTSIHCAQQPRGNQLKFSPDDDDNDHQHTRTIAAATVHKVISAMILNQNNK